MNLYAKIKESANTKAGNSIEEICDYVYKDCNGDMEYFPEPEQMDYIADVTKGEYNKIKKIVGKAIYNVADNKYNGYIELSDNSTLNHLRGNFDNEDPDKVMQEYGSLINSAFAEFEAKTGIEIWQDGRMGRHIIVEDNFYNAYHYDELCRVQEELENWVIDELEKLYPETEEE